MEVKRKLSEFLKRETVLTVAILLAIVSAVMIPPDREYAGYIDFRTLSILRHLFHISFRLSVLTEFLDLFRSGLLCFDLRAKACDLGIIARNLLL